MKTDQHLHISFNQSWQTSRPYPLNRTHELLNFHYLPILTFQHWQVEKQVRTLCSDLEKKNRIPQSAQWFGQLHKQKILTPQIPSIAICWLNASIGYGVFATQNIPAWSFVGEYTGILRRRKILFSSINDYCFRYPVTIWPFKYFTIDSEKHGNFTRFINHSDQPNVESLGVFCDGLYRVIVRTTRTISQGEELCYHYGPLYWKHRQKRDEFIPEEL